MKHELCYIRATIPRTVCLSGTLTDGAVWLLDVFIASSRTQTIVPVVWVVVGEVLVGKF